MTAKDKILGLIKKTVKGPKDFRKEKILSNLKVFYPEKKEHGDYSTNAAFVLKDKSLKPLEIAAVLQEKLSKNREFKKVEIAEPGFVNFFLSEEYLHNQIKEILERKEKLGSLKPAKVEKINVEFISANPTGPLTLGNARGGFCGDVLANILEKAGHKVSREYYVNDIGGQVEKKLKLSLEGKEGGYQGPHIEELRKRKIADPQEAAKIILKEWIKPTLKKMGINFNQYVFESSLKRKKIENFLKKKGLSYEKKGAAWFKSTQFGDDKDRVLRKTDGKQTYILSDIAYLKDKFERGFNELIYFLGAEHHGYIGRLKAAAEALGYRKEQVKPILFQLVKLLKEGKEVRMSKRKGIYITVDDLLKEINVDVARYFFLIRGYGNHLLFDLDLAKEQSEKNPVYYIQYAHARICSILKKTEDIKPKTANLELLNQPAELELIKYLIRLPEIIEETAEDYQVQRLPRYAHDLAGVFHRFYGDCQVLIEDKKLQEARLALVLATKIVLKETLNLMGISAPEKM